MAEETLIGYDINGDTKTGLIYTAGVATIGAVNLGTTQLGYAIKKGENVTIQIISNGDYVSPLTFDWILLAATEEGAGYRVYLKNRNTGIYAKWILDAKGVVRDGLLLSSDQVLAEETLIGYDINGDLAMGTYTVLSSVAYALGSDSENLILTGSAPINGSGNARNNIIVGNMGNNVLDGKEGVDILTGLGGADTFLFSTAQAYGTFRADHITDFSEAQGDLLRISRTAFGMSINSLATLTSVSSSTELTAALASTSVFVYDSSNGFLYWNQNDIASGFGGGGIFAVLDNAATFTVSSISLF